MLRLLKCLCCVFFLIACKKSEVTIIPIPEPQIPVVEPKETGVLEIFFSNFEKNGYTEGIKTIGNGENTKYRMSAYGQELKINSKPFFILNLTTFYSNTDYTREVVAIDDIPVKIGKYEVKDINPIPENSSLSAFYSRLMSDGDVLGAFYYLNINKKNDIEIRTIDTVTNIVTGKLNINFNRKKESADSIFPLRVSFTDMYFEVKLNK